MWEENFSNSLNLSSPKQDCLMIKIYKDRWSRHGINPKQHSKWFAEPKIVFRPSLTTNLWQCVCSHQIDRCKSIIVNEIETKICLKILLPFNFFIQIQFNYCSYKFRTMWVNLDATIVLAVLRIGCGLSSLFFPKDEPPPSQDGIWKGFSEGPLCGSNPN